MYEYKEVKISHNRVCKITCNKCGRAVDFGESDYQVETDFTEIKNTYQYGSAKDGDKYVSHVCEPCMDEFYASFKIQPQVVSMLVWGEEPPDPIVIAKPKCDECGGDLGGNSIGRLEEHVIGCSRFPL